MSGGPGSFGLIRDFDGDGRPDAVVSAGPDFYALRGDGKGQFGTATAIPNGDVSGASILDMVAADVNGDYKTTYTG